MDQMIHYNVIYTEKDSKTVIMESMKQGITLLEVAERHCERFEHDIVLTRVNGQLRELGHTVGDGDDIEMITTADEAGSQTYKRTACMIMTKAFTDVLGLDHTVYVHYSLGKGYYCEVKDLSPVSEDILAEVKTRMEEIVREGHPIIKKPMNKYEAQKLFLTTEGPAGSTSIFWMIMRITFMAIWPRIRPISGILIWFPTTKVLFLFCRTEGSQRSCL